MVDVPWKGSNDFGLALMEFVALTRASVDDAQRTALYTHAARLGDGLGQALVIRREIGDQQGEGSTLGNLGNAYEALGDKKKAKALWQEALTTLLPETPVYTQIAGWLQVAE